MNSPLIKNRNVVTIFTLFACAVLPATAFAQTSWSPFRKVATPASPFRQSQAQQVNTHPVQKAQYVQQGAKPKTAPTPAAPRSRAVSPAKVSTAPAQQPARKTATVAQAPRRIATQKTTVRRAPVRVAQAPAEVLPPGEMIQEGAIIHPGGNVYHDPAQPMGQVLQGNTPLAPVTHGGMAYMPGGCNGSCGGACGGCTDGSCGDCGSCDSCGTGTLCICLCAGLPWCEFEFETGVQGFTGPQNLGAGGSFGFHQAVNYSRAFPDFFNLFGTDLGMQAGFRTVQTDFSASNLTASSHNQTFFTAGLFHRVDWGLQFGGVVDYLTDQWYVNTELSQFRGEISWKTANHNEFGFRLMANSSTRAAQTAVVGVPVNRRSVFTTSLQDQYLFFYRTPVNNRGEFTAFAGLTGNNDGVFGSNIELPLNHSFAVRGGFTYLTPNSTAPLLGTPGTAVSVPGSARANWNISLSLVWYPCGFGQKRSNYNNALFNVGDNGSLLMNRTIR